MGPRESWLLAFIPFCNAVFSNGAGRQQHEAVLHLQVGSNISLHFPPPQILAYCPKRSKLLAGVGEISVLTNEIQDLIIITECA